MGVRDEKMNVIPWRWMDVGRSHDSWESGDLVFHTGKDRCLALQAVGVIHVLAD